MDETLPEVQDDLADTLAEGIAAVIEADAQLAGHEPGEPGELADLFLEELNRLWAAPADGDTLSA
jgi:hypothetical protein